MRAHRIAMALLRLAVIVLGVVAINSFVGCYNAAPYEPVSCWSDTNSVQKDTVLRFKSRTCSGPRPK